jgi:glyoxylase-like metal-dependent hydrolase (beta-lactamase superfamily II)
MTCGWLTGSLGNLLAGERGRVEIPVPCYLIDHPAGKVLFDTGLHVQTQTDPVGRLGAVAAFYTVTFGPGEELTARLAAMGIAPADIRFLVNSHLHFDHAGGNAQIPDATLVVQRREWEAAHDDQQIAANVFDPRDYDVGHEMIAVDGEHDLFGDGTVVCVPTYGHTPGHQALQVRLEGATVLLAADACYLRRTLESLHLPPVVHDRNAMLESLRRIRRLRDAGARIFYGHDPDFWRTVPQAPASLSERSM